MNDAPRKKYAFDGILVQNHKANGTSKLWRNSGDGVLRLYLFFGGNKLPVPKGKDGMNCV